MHETYMHESSPPQASTLKAPMFKPTHARQTKVIPIATINI